MQFTPEKYRIPDIPMRPFIDSGEIWDYLNNSISSPDKVREIVNKSLSEKKLNLEEVATLINATDKESIQLIKGGAEELKKTVYGNRIVLFAPLYVGNKCSNNCIYCGFRSSNKAQVRKTLSDDEIAKEDEGQKRLILVFGENTEYSPQFIANSAKTAFGPHTISFPRIKDASNLHMGNQYFVSDEDFIKMVAILRLSVPYTGLILTAREPAQLRDEVIKYGISQIDGGTKIEIGSYADKEINRDLDRGQFQINDNRTLNEIIDELLN